MDNKLIFNQFGELEHKVEQLIEICKQHEAEKFELKNKIESLEEELRVRVEAEKSYTEEKALIRSKIDGLLAKFDDVVSLSS